MQPWAAKSSGQATAIMKRYGAVVVDVDVAENVEEHVHWRFGQLFRDGWSPTWVEVAWALR